MRVSASVTSGYAAATAARWGWRRLDEALTVRHEDCRGADADAGDDGLGAHNDVALFALEVVTAQFHWLICRIGDARQSVHCLQYVGCDFVVLHPLRAVVDVVRQQVVDAVFPNDPDRAGGEQVHECIKVELVPFQLHLHTHDAQRIARASTGPLPLLAKREHGAVHTARGAQRVVGGPPRTRRAATVAVLRCCATRG